MRPDLLAEMRLLREMLQVTRTTTRSTKLKTEDEVLNELAAIMGPDFFLPTDPEPGKLVYDKFAGNPRAASCGCGQQ